MRFEATPRQDAGFPWGDNRPTISQRAAFAVFISLIAALMHFVRAGETAGFSDFTSVWYGARFLLEGQNPYELIGPGRLVPTPSPPFYPAPAFVAAIPLTLFSAHWAGTVFVLLSSALLAWGSTADGWHRLPLFPSIAFLTSVQLGQWSVIFTAAAFIPALAFISIAKPQASLPVVVGNRSSTAFWWSVGGGAFLLAASLWLMPQWPGEWWSLFERTDHFAPPIARFGGIAICLVLLRWRRAEAWLVFVAACVPQTWYPYNSLILLIVAATYREACVLSLVSSFGWVIAALAGDGNTRSPESREIMGAILVAACYLPATIVVLRRPDEGSWPFWMRWLRRPRDVYIESSGR